MGKTLTAPEMPQAAVGRAPPALRGAPRGVWMEQQSRRKLCSWGTSPETDSRPAPPRKGHFPGGSAQGRTLSPAISGTTLPFLFPSLLGRSLGRNPGTTGLGSAQGRCSNTRRGVHAPSQPPAPPAASLGRQEEVRGSFVNGDYKKTTNNYSRDFKRMNEGCDGSYS